MFEKLIKMYLPIFCMLFISACSAKPFVKNLFGIGEPLKTIKGEIRASDTINPNDQNQSAPVTLLFFELSDLERFQSSGFFPLLKQPQNSLGDQLLKLESYSIEPGQTLIVPLRELATNTRNLAVIAAFRNWQNANWRAVYEISKDSTDVDIELDSTSVRFVESASVKLNKIEPAEIESNQVEVYEEVMSDKKASSTKRLKGARKLRGARK